MDKQYSQEDMFFIFEKLMLRPVSFHRIFVTITESITAGLMLSQLWYWKDRGTNPDGWIFKTVSDWTKELGLGRWEQESARKILRKKGFIEEKRTGMPAQLFFRVNPDMIKLDILNLLQDNCQQENLHQDRRKIDILNLLQDNCQQENLHQDRRKTSTKIAGKPLSTLYTESTTESTCSKACSSTVDTPSHEATPIITNTKKLNDPSPQTKTTTSPLTPTVLVSQFCQLIHAICPKAKIPADLSKWEMSMRHLIDLDKADPNEIQFIIHAIFTGTDKDAIFWQPNILSVEKLRKHFPRLSLTFHWNHGTPDNGDPHGNQKHPDGQHDTPKTPPRYTYAEAQFMFDQRHGTIAGFPGDEFVPLKDEHGKIIMRTQTEAWFVKNEHPSKAMSEVNRERNAARTETGLPELPHTLSKVTA